MGLSASGATFTFSSDKGILTADVVSVSVETPEAQVADMTPPTVASNIQVLVPTGEYKGGAIQVEYIRKAGQADPSVFVGGVGIASFVSPGHTTSKRVYLRRASEEARVGDVVRGTLDMAWTDYAP